MVIQRSCSSLRVSVKRVSPAFAPAIIPALETNESVKVDFPWSTWAENNILKIFMRILTNDGHVSDVLFLVHQRTDLVDCKVNHFCCLIVLLEANPLKFKKLMNRIMSQNHSTRVIRFTNTLNMQIKKFYRRSWPNWPKMMILKYVKGRQNNRNVERGRTKLWADASGLNQRREKICLRPNWQDLCLNEQW